MKEEKSSPLSGKDNKRLNNIDVRNNEITYPLTDTGNVLKDSNMTIPPDEDVVHAKEWVDDGSQL